MQEKQPTAMAVLQSSSDNPELRGNVLFYDTGDGTIVFAEVCGVRDRDGKPARGFHGFHIHEGGACTDAGSHFTPFPMPHPDHAGDLPPLLMNHGCAWVQVYTDRFRPDEIIGRTIVLHDMPDDLRTQPSGDSGEKIACGEIRRLGFMGGPRESSPSQQQSPDSVQ